MKKTILLPLLLLVGMVVQATNYYVSSAGNDTYSGTSPATAWRTLAKVNASFSLINPGDSVLFRRGDVFYGSLIIGKSGTAAARIVVSAYGSGILPVLSGYTNVTGWTMIGTGIYQANVAAAKTSLNNVQINGVLQSMGRYPNASDANGGYLNYESYSSTSSSITDNELTATTNWTGANAVIRKNRWILDICKITNHVGGTLTYQNPAGTENVYFGLNNFGYFIQNDPRTLDQLGEWFLEKTSKNLQVFFGGGNPVDFKVNVSVIDTVLNLGARQYVTVENLAVEGSNVYGIYSMNGTNVTIRNCAVNYSGGTAILVSNVPSVLVENNSVNAALSNGIYVKNSTATPTTIRGNTVRNVATLAGMGESGDTRYLGLYAKGNGVLVEYNRVDSTGYNGIQFDGNDVTVRKNFVSNFCSVKDDGGGIYTWCNNGNTTYSNRKISNNIVLYGIGAKFGTNTLALDDVRGIYMDGGANNVSIENNTVAHCNGAALFYNNTVNMITRGNTLFNNTEGLSMQRFPGSPLLRTNEVKNNIFFPLEDKQLNVFYWNGSLNAPVTTTIEDDMRAIGKFDSNFYRNDISVPFDYYYHLTSGGTFVDPPAKALSGWQDMLRQDSAATTLPNPIPAYAINSYVTTNTVSNGTYNTNLNGTTFWASNSAFTATWDNSGKINGTACVKITPTASSAVFTTMYASVGAVTNAKKYILRFTTLGTTPNGVVKASLRMTNSPYTGLNTAQSHYFSTTVQRHEFLFTGVTASAAASFLIEVQQSSGTTYIDNIEFYEVTATPVAITSQVRFEYNATPDPVTINLGGSYVGLDKQILNDTVTIPAYGSRILLANTAIVLVDAGSDVVVSLPIDTTTLSGIATGTIVSYAWSKTSGPSQFLIKSPNNLSTVIDSLSPGKYTFQLKVTDNRGVVAIDSVHVIAAGILPVTLVNFAGRLAGEQRAALSWTTSAEINTSFFEVERSANGRNFASIGRVTASNRGNQLSSYQFSDEQVLDGFNYYRLKMVDADGLTNYSQTVIVNKKKSNGLQIDQLAIRGGRLQGLITSDKNQSLTCRVIGVNGSQLATIQVNASKGTTALNGKIQLPQDGVYYVQFATEFEVINKPVLATR